MRRTLLALLAFPAIAFAAPTSGVLELSGQDLNGTPRDISRYRGEKTLVVVLTDREGEPAVRAWFAKADQRMSPEVQRLSVVSLKLPFFVSLGTARSRARGEAPKQYWDDTLLDIDGRMAKSLGLEHVPIPYVFALDRDGRILASFHGNVGSPGAFKIWQALEGR